MGTQKILMKLRRRTGAFATVLATAIVGMVGLTYAVLPAGLDSRAIIGAYLDGNLPSTTSGSLPALLSQTTAYSNTAARTPHPGLIPFGVNSPLWTDGSLKSRYIGLPYDGTANSPKVGFTTAGAWSFPNGTVFVKNFDLVVNKQTGAIRRLETRILVRLADGGIRGATYKWLAGEADAQRIDSRTIEPIDVIQSDGVTVVQQNWTYPGTSDCLTCHNAKSGMVLGVKTAQLNGDLTYPAPGRTDNQLHTWHELGMFDQPIADPPSQYAHMVDVNDTTATMENRVKSYQDANCSHCHRPPDSFGPSDGPLFDMRYDTPILAPEGGRIPIVANSGNDGLIRRDIGNSSIHDRDGRTGSGRMPPIARNVPDQRILTLYNQWVNYAFDVTAATATSLSQVRLQFDRALEPTSATTTANFAMNNGVIVLQATVGADPSIVTLTTSTMAANSNYRVTVNRVKEATAPQNPIWPNTEKTFTTPIPTLPGTPSITGWGPGNGKATFLLAPPVNDGGSAILTYTVTCAPGPFDITGATSPLTVSGLTNGTSYSCTAKATNSVGSGPESSPPVSVTPMPTAPDAPTALTATPGNGSATLSFTAPNDNGAPITSYAAQCNPGAVPGSATASPIIVSGLTNGTAYACSVAATNSVNTGPYSLPVNMTPGPPKLLMVVSRKTHGTAGTFNLPIDHRIPIGGQVSVEPRVIGNGHQIVFQFDTAINSTGTPAATAGAIMTQIAGNQIIVTLTGVNDAQRVTITLPNINGSGVDATVSLGFLIGDVNNSRTVNATDTSAVKARAGQPVDAGNFFYDLNASGAITAADVSAAKARINRAPPL